jgi:LmbE family N-acetylglucosaminyl deacetylase
MAKRKSSRKSAPKQILPTGDKVILLLVAHADDTEFFAGGTIAKFASEGWEVFEAIATDNQRGSFEVPAQALSKQSEAEALAAARVLGKKDVIFLRYPDGMLRDYKLNKLREQFIRLIRTYKPRIVFTFDPWAPFEPHPDHQMVQQAAVEAVGFSHSPKFYPEHFRKGLQPHLVPEIYYFAKANVHANKFVDITDFIDKKIEALCAHDSQMKLTIDEMKLALLANQVAPKTAAGLDRNNYRGVIELMARLYAEGIGKKAGFKYGEEFRYELAGGEIVAAIKEMGLE